MNFIDHIFLGRDAWSMTNTGKYQRGEIVSVEYDADYKLKIGVVFYDKPFKGLYQTFKTDELSFLNPDLETKIKANKKYGRVTINTWPEGKAIQTIKAIRMHTNIGLKEAKDIIDETKIHPAGISIMYNKNDDGTYDKVRMDKETANKLFNELIEMGVSVQIEETDE